MQARQRFGAQVIEPLARALGGVAEGLQRAAASEQQIALDQVRETEVRFGLEQCFDVIERQIKAFKEGQRKNSMMSPAAVVLSDQDMQDLAEYFSWQTLVRSTAKTDGQIEALAQYLTSL